MTRRDMEVRIGLWTLAVCGVMLAIGLVWEAWQWAVG